MDAARPARVDTGPRVPHIQGMTQPVARGRRAGARRLAALSIVALSFAVTPASAKELSEKRTCRIGDPRCVDRVIREMDHRLRRLARRCDHDAIFALLYLRTTETFLDTLETIGYADPASVVREDALFADYYFRAFDAFHGDGGFVPPAWEIAFTAAEERAAQSPGNALLGFNAHIQRDLPFVLYDLHVRGTPVGHDDHTLVNDFLAQVDATAEVVERFDPSFDDAADPDGLFRLIVAWRELAFVNFVRLRDAPTPAARAAVAAEIEANAAGAAAAIAQSTAYPPGTGSSARDAFCEAARD
jgi:hypothetical protein